MKHSDEPGHGGGLRRDQHDTTSPAVQSATSAPISATAEQSQRIRRYLIAMSFRALCGVMAYFTMGWVRWTLVAAAIVLPYFAVVLANAVGPRSGTEIAPIETRVQALDAEPEPGTFMDDRGPTVRPTIHGTIVDGGSPS